MFPHSLYIFICNFSILSVHVNQGCFHILFTYKSIMFPHSLYMLTFGVSTWQTIENYPVEDEMIDPYALPAEQSLHQPQPIALKGKPHFSLHHQLTSSVRKFLPRQTLASHHKCIHQGYQSDIVRSLLISLLELFVLKLVLFNISSPLGLKSLITYQMSTVEFF